MGYTHYWRTGKIQAIPDPALHIIKGEIDRAHQAGIIQRSLNDPGAPIVTSQEIRFNGVGDTGHETFYFKSNGEPFDFCKTARKPYDTVVMYVLIVLKHFLKDNITVSSDGDFDNEWAEACRYMEERYEIVAYADVKLGTC